MRTSKGLYEEIRGLPNMFQESSADWATAGRCQVELVMGRQKTHPKDKLFMTETLARGDT
jgi:hypothetical protein